MNNRHCWFIGALLVAGLCLSPARASAAEGEVRGEVLKNSGEVAIRTESGEVRRPEETGYKIRERETIFTRTGRAVVRFVDGAMTVLTENSSLRIKEPGWFEQLAGKVMYAVGEVTGSAARRVSSSFATIGIRGTTFIVSDEADGRNIALREGSLAVESPDEPYEIHSDDGADDFAEFARRRQEEQQQARQEFEQYKQQERQAFVAYVREFKLEAGKSVHFDGRRVSKSGLSEETEREFDELAEFAGEHWRDFHSGADGRLPRDTVEGESEKETRERLELDRSSDVPEFDEPDFESLEREFENGGPGPGGSSGKATPDG